MNGIDKGWNLNPTEHALLIESTVSCGGLYEAYVRQYAELNSNYTFPVTQKSCSSTGVTLELQVAKNTYVPLASCIKHLATINKLILLTHVIKLLQYMKEHLEGVLVHSINHIYVNQGSEVRFIPVSPDEFTAPVAEHEIIKKIGFSLFDLVVPADLDISDIDERRIPHEIANYLLSRPGDTNQVISKEQIQRLDDFVFFQAWIYCDAVRVALADDELSLVEVKNLRQISSRLALCDAQAEQLENIAMLERQSFDHFLRSQQAE